MQYANLGRSGLKVSRLCLGTMNFGPVTTEEDSHAIMDRALELGVNFFDTADVYGWKKGEGWTEQIIGRWLAKGGRRDRIVLATKVYGAMGEGPNDQGLSAYHIRRACEGSLRRLQTDCIDLYQTHHIDRRTPVDEILEAMDVLVRQGKILYLGSSNFPAWHIGQFNATAAARGKLGLVSEQCIYSLADRMVELEVLPAAKHLGFGIIPWSPLGGGLLGGILDQKHLGRRASGTVQRKLQKHLPKVEKWEAFCKETNQPPAGMALAWLLANPVVAAPIIGPRTAEQLDDAVAALDLQLDEPTLTAIDAIWPGPGGPSPEAYSW